MSIETLLEAAKFLELQAQQQQRARDENALCERLCPEQERGKCKSKTSSTLQTSHANFLSSEEVSSPEPHHSPSSTLPPSPILPSPIPVTIVSLPVASSNVTPLHKSAAPSPTLPQPDAHSPQSQHALYQRAHLPPQSNGHKTDHLVQPFPGTLVRPQQQQPLIPQTVSSPTQLSIMVKASSLDDSLDSKKRPGGAGTREVHNKLEKNRRAHLKECFETLKKNIPNVDEKKTSNLSVLRSALRYIQTLKRKEKEYEHEMERLAREKISTQQRLSDLKNDLSQWMDMMEIERLVRQTVQPEDDQASTSTASEGEDNLDEDMEEEDTATLPYSLAAMPHTAQPDISKAQVAPPPSQLLSVLPKPQPHITVPCTSVPVHPSSSSSSLTLTPAHTLISQTSPAMVAPPNLAYGHIVAAPSLQPTVITHAASQASVIQAVNHVTQNGPKHIAHIASSTSTSSSSSPSALQLAPGPAAIRHITVHPVTHLPSIYPQPVTIAHTLSHSQAIGAPPLAKQTPVGNRVLAHHSQLVGQTVLNPVTMVTMPSFPVSTLKLA